MSQINSRSFDFKFAHDSDRKTLRLFALQNVQNEHDALSTLAGHKHRFDTLETALDNDYALARLQIGLSQRTAVDAPENLFDDCVRTPTPEPTCGRSIEDGPIRRSHGLTITACHEQPAQLVRQTVSGTQASNPDVPWAIQQTASARSQMYIAAIDKNALGVWAAVFQTRWR